MANRRSRGWVVCIAVLALVVAGCSGSKSQSSKKAGGKTHEGVSVNVLTFTGPQIAEPLQRRAPEFQRLTGAKINVVTVPFSDLYDKILTDMATRTNSYDAFVFDPQWMGDFVPPGFLEDISSRVQGDANLKWDDIAPFFRDFSASYQGHTYTIPLDGDFMMVYYRSDLLKKDGVQPPATWDDYLSIAKRYNGKDLNGDGKGDYGSCIAKKRSAQSYWMFLAIAGSYLQTQGTSQGAFFDNATMKPLVNNPAYAAALDVYKQTTQYGPPGELNLDVGDTRGERKQNRKKLMKI
jgi:multiple sugar transport system substrate-binding protein